MSQLKTEGWARPSNSKKWHYFRGMQSLCRKWGLMIHQAYEDDIESPDNCAECARRRAKGRAVAAGEEPCQK